jgi:3-deoxy-manno-octulosonate cytidylyltransferase (CMP-KDO synthetase)
MPISASQLAMPQSSMPSDLIVIPARYGSSRLPGKPLAQLAGVPLLARVVRTAQSAVFAAGKSGAAIEVVVATDDERVAALATDLGAAVVLSDPAIANGSLRTLDAASRQKHRPGRVVNLQGDAAFVTPAVLGALLAHMRQSEADVLTPVIRLDWPALDRLRARKRHVPFSGTTCVRTDDGRALWFSKTVLPAIRDEAVHRAASPVSPVWQHVGLYGYTMAALERFAGLPAGRYERLEGLEQLRMLEAGMTIQTVEVEWGPWSVSGIDSPEDIVRAEQEIAMYGDPLARL